MMKFISMSKYCRPVFFIMLSFLPMVTSGQTRQGFLDELTGKFRKYCNSVPREEIYVHTDRHEYVAGEVLWFSVYLIDRQSAKPSGDSKIAYFEILNPDNRPVVQKRIYLEEGYGPGQIVLPDSLSSGIYTLRAYTNWMKNFLPENCFAMRFSVLNALNNKSFNRNGEYKTPLSKILPETRSSVIAESGLNIIIEKRSAGDIKIIITSTRNFRLVEGNTCYVFIQTHGVINFRQDVSLSDEGTAIIIPGDLLIPGINHITLFSASRKPLFEKLIYTPFPETGSLNISETGNLKTREKIPVTIKINGDSSLAVSSQNISISIAAAGNRTFPGIDDYMIFGSEYGTLSDELMKSLANDVPADSIDILLSSMKSNWIDWNRIISGYRPVLKYKKETENHFIYGRLINKDTQVPDPDQYLFLSMPGKNATFRYAKTDNKGDFVFTIPLDQKFRDLIIQPENAERNNNIQIESSYSDKYPELFKIEDIQAETVVQNNSKLNVNYQVMKIYGSEEPPDKFPGVVFTGGTGRFYGKPDIELVMDNYIKLPVMQEVFFELIPGVFMRKKKTEYEITISDPVENKVYDKPPVLFIDGVVIKDPDVIANLDPEKVERIDAIKARYFVGDYMFLGLVNVITRKGDFSDVMLPDFAVRLPYRVTESVGIFTSPDYTSPERKQNRIPDFRNTLFWDPSVKTGKDGIAGIVFWTSDFRSDFDICVQGFSPEGTPVSISKTIKIK